MIGDLVYFLVGTAFGSVVGFLHFYSSVLDYVLSKSMRSTLSLTLYLNIGILIIVLFFGFFSFQQLFPFTIFSFVSLLFGSLLGCFLGAYSRNWYDGDKHSFAIAKRIVENDHVLSSLPLPLALGIASRLRTFILQATKIAQTHPSYSRIVLLEKECLHDIETVIIPTSVLYQEDLLSWCAHQIKRSVYQLAETHNDLLRSLLQEYYSSDHAMSIILFPGKSKIFYFVVQGIDLHMYLYSTEGNMILEYLIFPRFLQYVHYHQFSKVLDTAGKKATVVLAQAEKDVPWEKLYPRLHNEYERYEQTQPVI